jgi:hypothetical protein
MRREPGADCTYPTDYVPPRKYVLVISCIDFRLLDDLTRFLDRDNLTNRYYHVAFAGTSLAFREGVETPESFHFDAWGEMLADHVRAVLKLTDKKLYDIYLVEHRDCGAYRVWAGKDFDNSEEGQQAEKDLHQEYAGALRDRLHRLFAGLIDSGEAERQPRVLSFLMDVRGNIERLDDIP